jgi:hypothetical protein
MTQTVTPSELRELANCLDALPEDLRQDAELVLVQMCPNLATFICGIDPGDLEGTRETISADLGRL